MIGIEEDRLCKPYRPFASGRIPLEHGQSLYLFVVSLAAAVSLYNGLILVSLAYMLATKADGWKALSPKNAFGAFGFMCYLLGNDLYHWYACYLLFDHRLIPFAQALISAWRPPRLRPLFITALYSQRPCVYSYIVAVLFLIMILAGTRPRLQRSIWRCGYWS